MPLIPLPQTLEMLTGDLSHHYTLNLFAPLSTPQLTRNTPLPRTRRVVVFLVSSLVWADWLAGWLTDRTCLTRRKTHTHARTCVVRACRIHIPQARVFQHGDKSRPRRKVQIESTSQRRSGWTPEMMRETWENDSDGGGRTELRLIIRVTGRL